MTERVDLSALERGRMTLDVEEFAVLVAAARALPGLLEIAELAMPDSFFASDSRVVAAQSVVERIDFGGADD